MKKNLKERVRQWLVFIYRLDWDEDIFWVMPECTDTHVRGWFTHKNRNYEIITDIVSGDMTPRIIAH